MSRVTLSGIDADYLKQRDGINYVRKARGENLDSQLVKRALFGECLLLGLEYPIPSRPNIYMAPRRRRGRVLHPKPVFL